MNDTPEKQCTICGESFPATPEFFHRDKRLTDGLFKKCKTCKNKLQREKAKVYYSNTEVRERRRAYHKVYNGRPDIQERKHMYDQDYYSRPEIQKHHSEHMKAYHDVRNSLPEVYERMRVHSHNRKAREREVAGTYTSQQLIGLLKRQKHKCYYCSIKFEQVKGKYIYHVEHTFPLSRIAGLDIPANDISYIVLACPSCNWSKNDKFPWEFYQGGRLL